MLRWFLVSWLLLRDGRKESSVWGHVVRNFCLVLQHIHLSETDQQKPVDRRICFSGYSKFGSRQLICKPEYSGTKPIGHRAAHMLEWKKSAYDKGQRVCWLFLPCYWSNQSARISLWNSNSRWIAVYCTISLREMMTLKTVAKPTAGSPLVCFSQNQNESSLCGEGNSQYAQVQPAKGELSW